MINSFINKIDHTDRSLYFATFFSAFTFLLSQVFNFTYNYSFILKAVPIISLIILAVRHLNNMNRGLLIIGLLFCMLGDILLDINRVTNFKIALAVYLIGHLFYISIFHKKLEYKSLYLLPMISVFIASLVIGYFLRNIPKDLLIPVIIYLTVIAIMVMSSFLFSKSNWLIWGGAILFMISDTVIAINKFLVHIPKSTFFNIGLYYLAQILLVTGLLIALSPKFSIESSINKK